MDFLENVVTTFNDGVWSWILPWLLIAAGLFFGIRTALVQVRMVPDMFRAVVERPKGEGRDEDEDYGGLSAFKAFTISAASRVGTCLLYTSPSPRDATLSRMPSSGCG